MAKILILANTQVVETLLSDEKAKAVILFVDEDKTRSVLFLFLLVIRTRTGLPVVCFY